MSRVELQLSGWFGAMCLLIAAFVYVDNTGSQHTATNPDEYLYIQIMRLTAETGHWLPLQSAREKYRNTKPPALFWQGIASTDWGKNWELWRLRLPAALYSLATAVLVLFLGRKLGGGFSRGAIAALAYLAFLGVYRHGRVFLTSAPETFWLFLPFFVLLVENDPRRLGWSKAAAFGLIVGIGLLWKSFAMVIPAVGALAWWTWKQDGYRTSDWLRKDALKLALVGVFALAIFSLWFWLDPQRGLILGDFILKENVGKFDAGSGSYLFNAVSGKHSIWAYALGWMTNAGLVAPAVIAVAVLSWKNRRHLSDGEQLLWIWIITLFVFHLFPNLRYERYLLPAMPAVAVLCGIYWENIPRWVLLPTLFASGAAALVLLCGAAVLSHRFADVPLYSAVDWLSLGATVLFCAAGIVKNNWTRAFVLPGVLLAYGAYAIFLHPFDGPIGNFKAEAMEAAKGRKVIAPLVFYGKDELYRFLLPEADVQRIREKDFDAAKTSEPDALFLVQVPLDDRQRAPEGFRLVGERLTLRDYYTATHMSDMVRGNIANNVFAWDLLIESDRSGSAPPGQN